MLLHCLSNELKTGVAFHKIPAPYIAADQAFKGRLFYLVLLHLQILTQIKIKVRQKLTKPFSFYHLQSLNSEQHITVTIDEHDLLLKKNQHLEKKLFKQMFLYWYPHKLIANFFALVTENFHVFFFFFNSSENFGGNQGNSNKYRTLKVFSALLNCIYKSK